MPASHPTRTVRTSRTAAIAALTLAAAVWPFSSTSEFFPQDSFWARRQAMVRDQVQSRGIIDSATLAALKKVQRHQFVPRDRIAEAYEDGAVPIGYGQTISQPYIVALMTELLQVGAGDRVLEVGTGSGYQAAVLAEIIDTVYTIEIVDELARSASERLSRLRFGNVQVRSGDGYYGWPERAPFDAIIVTAAAEHIPPPLLTQLKNGGRMVIPVGHPFFVQNLILVEKHNGSISTRTVIPVRFVPFTRSE